MFVCALMVVFAGIATQLQEQMRQGVTVKAISQGKIQAFYLAEMGVNECLFWANQNPSNPAWPSNGATIDFTSKVTMVRNTSGSAKCTYVLTSTSPRTYQVQSTLTLTDGSTYTKGVQFTTASETVNSVTYWVLSSYVVLK